MSQTKKVRPPAPASSRKANGTRAVSAEESQTIEYEPQVLEEIRACTTDASRRQGRGGAESIGVLFGKHSHCRTAVCAMRTIPPAGSCGGVFAPHHQALRDFERVLLLPWSEPALAGLEPVGCFISEGGTTPGIQPSAQELFDRYFRQNWQLALILRHSTTDLLRACTLTRDCHAPGDHVLSEFSIQQGSNSGFLDSTEATPAHEAARPRPCGPRSRKGVWMAATTSLCIIAIAGSAALFRLPVHLDDSVGLQAYERDGVLHIGWNADSQAIHAASAATLELLDGRAKTVARLTKDDLKHGMFATQAGPADVTARLLLFQASGHVKQETVRYVVPPVPREQPLTALNGENQRLRASLAVERRKTEHLKSEIRVLRHIVQARRRR